MLEDGEGEPADAKEALYWFNRAADHGSGDGVFNIARLCDSSFKNALGTQEDAQLALKLYKKAAAMGVVEAELKVKKIQTLQRFIYRSTL